MFPCIEILPADALLLHQTINLEYNVTAVS